MDKKIFKLTLEVRGTKEEIKNKLIIAVKAINTFCDIDIEPSQMTFSGDKYSASIFPTEDK